MNNIKTATLVQDNLPGYKGHAALFKLSPPLESTQWDLDTDKEVTLKHEYVVLSSVAAAFDHGNSETFIFPADTKGKVTDWGELPGSQRGTMNHNYILHSKGYQVVK